GDPGVVRTREQRQAEVALEGGGQAVVAVERVGRPGGDAGGDQDRHHLAGRLLGVVYGRVGAVDAPVALGLDGLLVRLVPGDDDQGLAGLVAGGGGDRVHDLLDVGVADRDPLRLRLPGHRLAGSGHPVHVVAVVRRDPREVRQVVGGDVVPQVRVGRDVVLRARTVAAAGRRA